jgi:hypothetical protein
MPPIPRHRGSRRAPSSTRYTEAGRDRESEACRPRDAFAAAFRSFPVELEDGQIIYVRQVNAHRADPNEPQILVDKHGNEYVAAPEGGGKVGRRSRR